jgi:hypothetical protein
MNYQQQLKDRMVKQFGEPQSLDELAQTVIQTINTYRDHSRAHRPKTAARVVGFAWDIAYGEVSNTHDCPIKGKTNWGRRDKDAPTSYPGWRGRVWIRYGDEHRNGFGSDPFGITLTYPGTGGWGSYSGPFQKISKARFARYGHRHNPEDYPEPQIYSWDYRFYEDDWPAVKDWVEKQKVVAALTNTAPKTSHKFEWWDPAIRARDDQFLKDPATILTLEKFKQYS